MVFLAVFYNAIQKFKFALGELPVMQGNINQAKQLAKEPYEMALSDSKSNEAALSRQAIAMDSANAIATMITKKWGNDARVGINGEVFVKGEMVGRVGTPRLITDIFGAGIKTTLSVGAQASADAGYHDTATFSVDNIKQAAYDRVYGILNSNESAQQKESQLNNFYGALKELRESSGNIANKATNIIDGIKNQNDGMKAKLPDSDNQSSESQRVSKGGKQMKQEMENGKFKY